MHLTLSTKKLLISIQLLVFTGWFIQLTLHQTWLYSFTQLSWTNGFYLSILLSAIPLTYSFILLRSNNTLPTIKITSHDLITFLTLCILGLFCWWYFASAAIYYPLHTYGDEEVHFPRVQLMVADFHAWFNFFFHHGARPEFHDEYLFYPALSYVPVSLWTLIKGANTSMIDQRMFLVINYLAVVGASFLFAKSILKSNWLSALIAIVPLSSALLLSYTMSFYIELHYVSVIIFSFWLLAWGMRDNKKELVITAVLVASLVPIMRESAIAATSGIVFAAMLWHFFNFAKQQNLFKRLFFAAWYLVIGLLPFVMYYLAKSNYSDRDVTRMSLNFISQQDYLSLALYSIIYLGPLALLALLFSLRMKRAPYLILAAICGIGGGIGLQAIFLPGYMPWSRNYLFYYADFIVLIILFMDFAVTHSTKSKLMGISALLASIFANFLVTICLLNNNNYFHETEYVFDVRPIVNYITSHRAEFDGQTIYVFWPRNFPADPEKLLPEFVHVKKITSLGAVARFLDFKTIRYGMPKEAQYVLYYYARNESRPVVFRNIPAALQPEGEDFKVLVDSQDAWAKGRNGVMLLRN